MACATQIECIQSGSIGMLGEYTELVAFQCCRQSMSQGHIEGPLQQDSYTMTLDSLKYKLTQHIRRKTYAAPSNLCSSINISSSSNTNSQNTNVFQFFKQNIKKHCGRVDNFALVYILPSFYILNWTLSLCSSLVFHTAYFPARNKAKFQSQLYSKPPSGDGGESPNFSSKI